MKPKTSTMKSSFFLLVITSLAISTGCSKENEIMMMSPPPAQTDKLTKICREWQLNQYTVKTDIGDYAYTGSTIASHAFQILTFDKSGAYYAKNDAWSGTFKFSDDSLKIIMQPYDTNLLPIFLNIDEFFPQQIHLSSPQVDVNPENPKATPYENLVAFQGLSWLYARSVNISKLSSIKIHFKYYVNQRRI